MSNRRKNAQLNLYKDFEPRSDEETPHSSDNDFIASDNDEHICAKDDDGKDDLPASLLHDFDNDTLQIYIKSMQTNQRVRRKRKRPKTYYEEYAASIKKVLLENKDEQADIQDNINGTNECDEESSVSSFNQSESNSSDSDTDSTSTENKNEKSTQSRKIKRKVKKEKE